MLKIYNTMTRKKEVFVPLVEGNVKIYTCGQTVYRLPTNWAILCMIKFILEMQKPTVPGM